MNEPKRNELNQAACSVPLETECPRCDEKGRSSHVYCTVCNNTGWVTIEKAKQWEAAKLAADQSNEIKIEFIGQTFGRSTQNTEPTRSRGEDS